MDHSLVVKYLPPEIWRHILTNLPVKTLVRFRCVCKSWCFDIDHPDFVYAVKRHKINSNTSKIFALEAFDLRRDGTTRCLLTNRQGHTLRQTAHIFDSCNYYYILGRCNELLLMGCKVAFNGREKMSLWNPSIRKSLLIPSCPLPYETCLFGFAPRSKDYKVITISYETEMSVAVYTLSDQQWTVQNNDLGISISDIDSTFGSYDFPLYALYFEDAAYWIVGKPVYKSANLISFNFDSEKFSFMEIPAGLKEPKSQRFLFLLEESLALLSLSKVSLAIWVMEQGTGKGAWTLWFSRITNYVDYGIFLSRRILSIVLYHENADGRFFLFGDKSYNIFTGQVREFENSMGGYFDLGMYTDSLVLWKGYGAENMASLP